MWSATIPIVAKSPRHDNRKPGGAGQALVTRHNDSSHCPTFGQRLLVNLQRAYAGRSGFVVTTEFLPP